MDLLTFRIELRCEIALLKLLLWLFVRRFDGYVFEKENSSNSFLVAFYSEEQQ